jgi:hypothetical protein
MDDNPTYAPVPAGWHETLAQSEADLAAGRIVPGDAVIRDLRESLAGLEATAAKTTRKGMLRR